MVMAKQLPALPQNMESIFSPSCRYSRSRIPIVPRANRSAFAYDMKQYSHLCFVSLALPSVKMSRRMSHTVRSMVDDRSSDPSGSNTKSGTRLVRAIQSFQTKLNTRIKDLKKGLSVKILFFLVGFYCATAFSTVIGQTGDWDILSAGLAVVVVEAIGALMYRASLPFLKRVKSLITMFNYWKAGLSLGLFLDAFKYEMDLFLESCNPFNIEIDIFPIFW